MARRLNISEARDLLLDLPEPLGDEEIIITHRRKPVAVLMDFDAYEGLLETLEILSDPEFSARLRKGMDEIERGEAIPLETVVAEFEEERKLRARTG